MNGVCAEGVLERRQHGHGPRPDRGPLPGQFTTNTEACGQCNKEETVPHKAKEGTAGAEV